MIKSKNTKQKWLPLALVPLFSVAVLAGCSSDDDDDGGSTTPVVVDPIADPDAIAGDADGSGVSDAFETAEAEADANGNGIIDTFESPVDDTIAAADSNNNDVDDSFEASLTGGADANADGIDDAAFEALTDGGAAGGDGTTPDTPVTTTPVVVDQTGPIANIPVGEVGITALAWDGTNLSGQVNIVDDTIAPASAGIYAGISAAGVAQQITPLNGNPTFFVPSQVGPTEQVLIANNIISGNLFVRINLVDGSTRDGIVLLDGVLPGFAEELNAASLVPVGTAISTGRAFINVNTVTGNFSAVLDVNGLQATDVDAAGLPEVISAANIHVGGPTENGTAIVELEDSGNGTTWTSVGVLSAENLASVLEGNSYFSVLGTNGTDFIRGQVPAFPGF